VSLAVAAHEHPSLLHPARSLARCGFDLQAVAVGREGLVDPDGLPADEVGVLGLSLAHAELGVLQPVPRIIHAARRGGARVVVDATLAAGRIGVVMENLGAPDLLTLSFHHFGGPMGVGALVIGKGRDLPPMIEGGVQEDGRRPGSPNLAGWVGAGVTASVARQDLAWQALRAAGYSREEARGALVLCIPPTASISRTDARRATGEILAEIERLRAIGGAGTAG
jgi:cysteine desulfurase